MSKPAIRPLLLLILLACPLGVAAAGFKFISQVVPQTMEAGKTYRVAIQYKNETSNTLSRANGYELRLVRPRNTRTWGVYRARLAPDARVDRNEIATFTFEVTAPARPGSYEFQWRLHHERAGWVGERTPLHKVEVGPSQGNAAIQAEFIYQKLPGMQKAGEYYTIMEQGQAYPVTMVFKNTGNRTWRPGEIELQATSGEASLHWSVDKVRLGDEDLIRPGEVKTFNFTILTPLEPGIYPFQWRLNDRRMGRFGQPSDPVTITVR